MIINNLFIIITVSLNFWIPKKIKIIIFCWPLLNNKFTNIKLISVGSHCLDILPARADDPEWLTAQRNEEFKIIKIWLGKYYKDLHMFA